MATIGLVFSDSLFSNYYTIISSEVISTLCLMGNALGNRGSRCLYNTSASRSFHNGKVVSELVSFTLGSTGGGNSICSLLFPTGSNLCNFCAGLKCTLGYAMGDHRVSERALRDFTRGNLGVNYSGRGSFVCGRGFFRFTGSCCRVCNSGMVGGGSYFTMFSRGRGATSMFCSTCGGVGRLSTLLLRGAGSREFIFANGSSGTLFRGYELRGYKVVGSLSGGRGVPSSICVKVALS